MILVVLEMSPVMLMQVSLFGHLKPNLILVILSIQFIYHTSPLDELKGRAYYMWHYAYSHAINDCNIFCQ
jgi:hypothetical protein